MASSYTELLNELNKEMARNEPEDVLQYCASFFQKKLEIERQTHRRSVTQTHETQESRQADVQEGTTSEGLFTGNSFGGPSATSLDREVNGRSPSPGASNSSSKLPLANYSFPSQDSGGSLFNDVASGARNGAAQQVPDGPTDTYPQNYNANRRTSVSAESMLPSADNTYKRVVIPKTQTQYARIDRAISQNLLFKNLDEEQLKDVLDAMSEKKISTVGSVIIKQGDVGDFFYVVESGSFDIFVQIPDRSDESGRGFGKKVAEAKEGGSFGELALMYNAPRAATVVSRSSDCVVWALDRITFRRILMENTSRKRKMYESFLETVHVLSALELPERQKIADSLDTCVFDKGAVVIRQGDVGEQFFMIESGEADVVKDGEGVIARLGKGDYFGESALINDAPRNATVQAATRLKVATLGKRAFVRLLGPVLDIMKREQKQS